MSVAQVMATAAENDNRERIRELYPLRWFLVLWLGVVYMWSGQWSPLAQFSPESNLRSMEGIAFALLIVVHAAGHWLSISLIEDRRRLTLYLLGQAGVALALSLISQSPIVAFLLSITLGGASVLLLNQVRPAALAIAGCLLLLLLALPSARRSFDPPFFFMFGVPLMLFVAASAALFLRQANARLRSQTLLRELEASHLRLSEYAQQVEALTLKTERQRLARELHDTLAQGLAGLIMQLEAIDTHLERGSPERAQAVTEQAMTRARKTLGEARRAIQSLRSEPATNQKLDSLRQEVDQFTAVTSIPCALEITSGEWIVPPDLAEQALRIVQEGLTNIARHAHARNARVRWACQDEALEVRVQDDGAGFDPASEFARDGHFGLRGLRERVQLAGGTLQIVSAPGRGTSLSAHLPIEAVDV